MIPDHGELVGDLQSLREKGLIGLRKLRLRGLLEAAEAAGLTPLGTPDAPSAVEELVRRAVDELGGGRLGEAAAYAFGLAQGTRDWPAQDRRRRGAEIYGVSVDRFRKHYERVVMEQAADAILRLCERATAPPSGVLPGTEPLGGIGPMQVVEVPVGSRTARITVHTCSVEMLFGIDVIVASENTYFELAHTFNTSLSACLRRAASTKGPSGEIIDDTMARELAAWTTRHSRSGLAVAPGTVAPTTAGELVGREIVRIYHAAVAAPRPGTNGYVVDPPTISLAVANVFALARAERDAFPGLASICLPLFGAGRGGVPEPVSFSWIWASLAVELAKDSSWQVHFVAREFSTATTIVEGLRALG